MRALLVLLLSLALMFQATAATLGPQVCPAHESATMAQDCCGQSDCASNEGLSCQDAAGCALTPLVGLDNHRFNGVVPSRTLMLSPPSLMRLAAGWSQVWRPPQSF